MVLAAPLCHLQASASGKANQILAYVAGTTRWNMQMGNAAAEGDGNAGSDWALHRYDNAGGYLGSAMHINRANGLVTTGAGITASGSVTSSQNFASSTANVVFVWHQRHCLPASCTALPAAPHRSLSTRMATTELSSTGSLIAGKGVRWQDIGQQRRRAAATSTIWPTSRPTCASTSIPPISATSMAGGLRLPHQGERQAAGIDVGKVKALQADQLSRRKAFRDHGGRRHDEKWGFVAHELQETLRDLAATGNKDDENAVQHPNLWC